MATRSRKPNLTVLEYLNLMDVIAAGLDEGQRLFSVQSLAETTGLTDRQVYVTLSHLAEKHEYVTDAGDGSYRITSDLEA